MCLEKYLSVLLYRFIGALGIGFEFIFGYVCKISPVTSLRGFPNCSVLLF